VTRPSWDEYSLGVAQAVAARADCTRLMVGAVVVDTDHRISGAGYNGMRPGGPSCLKGDCPRGRHYQSSGAGHKDCDREPCAEYCHDDSCTGRCGANAYHDIEECTGRCWTHEDQPWPCPPKCACGNDWPCPEAVPPGSSYDTGPGACLSTHAEVNAIMDVNDRSRLDGATLYCTHAPCGGCMKIIRNSTKIARICWPDGQIILNERVAP
jgi:deoxycytidylate deaminase